MEKRKLIPYSVYLPEEHYKKLRKAAKDRKASALMRDAVMLILDGGDTFQAGYKKGVLDSVRVIADCKEAQMVAIQGTNVGKVLSDRVKDLI